MKILALALLVASTHGLLNPNDFPCGTFMRYDTVNGRNDPALYGLYGGTNFDGTDEFIGYGDNTNCDQILSSGFISTQPSIFGGPGAFLPCGVGISFDDKNAFYLLKNSELEWVPTDNAAMFTVPNVLNVTGNFIFAFGRVYKGGKYRVGKLHFDLANAGIYIQLANGTEECYESGFEILTCCKDETTTRGVVKVTTTLSTTQSTTTKASTTSSTTTEPTTTSTTKASTTSTSKASTTSTTKASTTTTVSTTLQPSTLSTTPKAPLTTTIDPLKYPCGTFIKFDSINGKNDLFLYGYQAGINYDNTPEFIGYGDNPNCNNEVPCAGYAAFNGPKGSGVYMPCSFNGGLQFDAKNGFYLLKNEKLQWTITNKNSRLNVPNILVTSNKMSFGRIFIDGQYRVGKVISDGTFYVQLADNRERKIDVDDYEILTCESDATSTTSIPQTTTINPLKYPCGTFAKFDPINGKNDPNIYGVLGGVNYDDSAEYIGYGFNSKCNENNSAGFISSGTSSYPSGVYMPCIFGQSFDNQKAFYLLENVNLKWVSTSIAEVSSLDGVIKSGQYAWGRVKIDGQFRVGKVNQVQGGFYVQYKNDTEFVYKSGFEVLTCCTDQTTTEKPPSDVCGTFMKFDPINGQKDLALYGYQAGLNYDNTPEFIGYGNNHNCGENPSAGFASLGSSLFGNQGAGVYTPCRNGLYVDKKTPYYLVNNPKLKWVKTNYQTFTTVQNLLLTSDKRWAWGRIYHEGQYRVGRADLGLFKSFFVQMPDNTEKSWKTDFEILTCDERPVIDPNQYPCGSFVKYDTVNGKNDVTLYGHLAGVNYDNSPEFIGYGNGYKCNENPCAGYISTGTSLYGSQAVGALMPCVLGISFDSQTAHYLLNNKNLKWIETNKNNMKKVGNLVKTPNEAMAWGRIKDQGQYRVGKILLGHGGFFVQWANNTEKCYDQSNFEILTCARGARLYAGQCLYVGDALTSDKNCFRLILQTDGNLVVYRNSDNIAVWATGTYLKPTHRACMQKDGNFVLYDKDNKALWSTGTNNKGGSVAYLQDDAQLSIRGENDAMIWVSGRVKEC